MESNTVSEATVDESVVLDESVDGAVEETESARSLRTIARDHDQMMREVAERAENLSGSTDQVVLDPPYPITFEWVTPKRAAHLLSQSGKVFRNRPISARNLERMVGTMVRNEFRDTGDTVKITDDGAVIDGQHRLLSIVVSGKAQGLHIAYGVDPDVFRHVDQNYRRTFSQMLSMEGWSDSLHRAAVIRKAFVYNEYGRFDPPYAVAPTPDQLFAFMDENPDIHDALHDTSTIQRGLHIRTGVIGTLCWVFRKIHDDDAEFFIAKLSGGDGLATDDPIYRLRERIIQSKTKTSVRFSEEELGAFMIIAWNAFRQGRKLGYIRWRSGGARPDAFPEPV